jgi:transposase-like protein
MRWAIVTATPMSSSRRRSSWLGRRIGLVTRSRSRSVSDGALASWINEAERDEEPGALSRDERAELTRLRKQLAEVTEEREILRKAAQYFARETTR